MNLVTARLLKGPSRMGWASYWIVDEEGRQLHTEPVCTVPDGWHTWFKERIEEWRFEYYGLLEKEDNAGEDL